jgi:DNA-binding NtrC family response regulator
MAVHKAWEHSSLIRENVALRQELEIHQGFEGIIGDSRPMERVFALARRVAPTDGTVLLIGESGTGKEMFVRAIHRLSRRKDHPLLACDCSALAPTLLESELFGHVKGSFSGAIATKCGLFEAADKGTLFLDEIGNLSMETQGKLLRALETRRVKKVGDTTEHEVDIRLISATNRDLTFLERFCKKNQVGAKGFSPEAMCLIESYQWPGNVRELRNIVERLAILCDHERIEPHHLPAEIRQAIVRPQSAASLPRTWEEFKLLKQQVRDSAVQQLERRFLVESLERCKGNVSRAAEEIGIQRTNFHALMRKYGLTSDV